MSKVLEKICLAVIFVGIIFTLFLPLAINSSFLFPFIFTKVVIFRIVVAVMLLAYLFLVYLNTGYRPKINFVLLSIIIFIVGIFISSLVGLDFNLSFWGDIERGEGLILWLHLLIYFVILTSVLNRKTWFYLINFSLVASLLLALFAIGQRFEASFLVNDGGERIGATIGNAAFLAVYMMFQMAFAAYLMLVSKSKTLRGCYLCLLLIFGYVVIETKTRGAFLGLLAGFFVAGGLVLYKFKSKVVKISIGVICLLVLLGGSFIYINKNSSWVKNNATLDRLASISLKERTAQTRLVTWQAAWNGWTESPKSFILGYGLENFTKVFDKNFPPIIYQDEGSQVWFDRAHNFIFDRGLTGGIFSLLVYLIIILYPVYFLIKKYLPSNDKDEKILAIVFISFIAAFLVQNLFVFETITTYIILFFTWAFLASFMSFKQPEMKFNFSRNVWLILFLIYLGLLWPLILLVNIKPARANLDVALALRMGEGLDSQEADYSFFDVVEQYKKALESETYGVPEYRVQFIDFIGLQLASVGEVISEVKPVIAYTDQQVDAQLKDKPNDAKNYLVAMRHYDYTFASIPEDSITRLDKALTFFPPLEKLSPTRPHIYQEAGYANLYKYRLYQKQQEFDLAEKASAEAEKYFNKTIDLNPQVVESYDNLIMFYLNTNQGDKINRVVELMDERGVNFRQPSYLNYLIQLSVANSSYEWTAWFCEELIKVNPENIGAWTKLALAYAYSGQIDKAIETAEKIKLLPDEGLKQQADIFIEELKAGKYASE